MVSPDDVLAGKALVPNDVMVAYLTLANMNKVLTTKATLTQARNAIKFVDGCLQAHYASMVDIALKSLRGVAGLSKLPEYQKLVKDYGNLI
jgi:hypothetical protein